MDFDNMIWQRIGSFYEELQNIFMYHKNKTETKVTKWKLMKVGT